MISKLTIKNKTADLFHKVGGFRLFCHLIGKEKAFVLMYHRILGFPQQENVYVQPGMYVTTETFRQHMAFLKDTFHTLSLSELIDRIIAGKSIKKCCAITFDDGWHDTFTNAYPVLQEFNVRATIFLATRFIGSNRLFWPEEFSFYMRYPDMRNAIRKKSQVLNEIINRLTGINENQLLDECISTLKSFSEQERKELLNHLRSLCTESTPDRILLNWGEARQMQASGLISFGGHTANHVILDQVSEEKAEEEIAISCRDLKSHLGIRPELFAYPNGNYNTKIKSLVKKYGINSAVTTKKGWLTEENDLLEIPRIGIHEDVSQTIPLFLARIFLKRF